MSRCARPSPSVSATLYPNQTKKGNDGHMYQPVANKNNTFCKLDQDKKPKLSSRTRRDSLEYYQTLCNDPSEEYLVGFSKKLVSVWRRRRETMDEFSTDKEWKERKHFDQLVWQLKNPMKVMPGESPLNKMTEFSGGEGPEFKGNTLLVQKSKNVYVFIGCGGVYSFTLGTHEMLVKYVSPLGNNSVPYPYMETNKYIYLLPGHSKVGIEEYRVKTQNHPDIEDPYDALWHHKELKLKEVPFVMKRVA